MAFVEQVDFSTEEDLKTKRVEPGWYHFALIEADRNKDNNAIVLTVEVLAGNVADQQGRRIQTFYNDPSPSHSDGGRFAKALKTKLLLALGLITPDNLGGKGEITWGVGPNGAIGRQFIGLVGLERGKDGKDYSKLQQNEVYRVDDPTMAHVPKNQAALSLVLGGMVTTHAQSAPAAAQPAATQAPVSAPPAAAPAPAAPAAADPFAGL